MRLAKERNTAMKLISKMLTIFPAVVLSLAPSGAFASKQARGYGHAFENGNLISNWSFEAIGQTWDQNAKSGGFTVDPRFKMSSLGGTNKAVSGAFAGKITGMATTTNAAGNFSFYTPYLPMRATITEYTLSMYVRSSGVVGTVNPSIRLYREKDNPASLINSIQGQPYGSNADWTLYRWSFYAGSEQNYFQLALSETYTAGHGGTFYFDDVVLEEWGSASPRDRIQESVVYADALGRTFQSQSVVSGSTVTAFPGWTNSAQITINTTASGANIRDNVSGFPLLVRLSNSNFNFSEARADGYDIRFTDVAGNPIAYETEMWSATSGVASIWVRVPMIEGNKADNVIFMYWGNPSAGNASSPPGVFDAYSGSYLNYHMAEKPLGDASIFNASNSTRNADSQNMTSANWVAGKIGYNLDFNNILQRISNEYMPSSISAKSLTFSAWVKLRPPVSGQLMYLAEASELVDGCADLTNYIAIEGNKLTFSGIGGFATSKWQSSQTLNADNATYYHVAVTYQNESTSSVPLLFVNGRSTPLSISKQPPTYYAGSINSIFLGNICEGGSQGFNGAIDEFRLENTVHSPDWIKMEYEVEKSGSAVVNINKNVRADQPTKAQNDGVTYDKFGRSDRTYLPCKTNSSDLTDPATCAQDPEMPNMGGYNYAQGVYAQEPGDRALEMGFAGANYHVGSGHTAKSDYYYVSTLAIPANIEVPPAATAADTVYRFSWSKDPDGNYSLQWSNRKGQSTQKALNINRVGATPNLWQWSISKFDYYRDGSMKRTRTPLDVAAGNTNFSVVSSHNTLGQAASRYAPDQGLIRHWYNRSGKIRYTQDAGQRAGSGYTFYDYDNQGRLIGTGPQAITGAMDQTIADQDAFACCSKNENIGYIYDDLSTFQARTGLSLSSIMPDSYTSKADFLESRNGFGRLICKYNRNLDNPLPGFTNADKFVAEFFVYNREGEVERVFKYLGPIRTADQKYQEAVNYYDDGSGQLRSETIYSNALSGTVSMYYGYEYDEKGRIKTVKGDYGSTPIAEFSYMDWGPVKYMILGGDGSGNKGTKVEYAYHTSGGVQEIRATQLGTGKILFQQYLGYDGKAQGDAKVPANTARYNGTITQQLYKFADDVNSLRPVRVVNYNFDELGRMLSADYQKNTAGNPLNADGSINFAAFSFENSPDNDSYMAYDLNGRISSQSTGGQSPAAVYNYQANSYKLNTVSGKLSPTNTRNLAAGFVYSSRGAMTSDKSKDLLIAYDWNLMPVRFTKNSVSSPTNYQEQYCFYDADGQRVDWIQMQVTSGTRTWYHGKHYITLNSRPYKEWEEQYSGTSGSISYTSETHNLLGPSVVGRWNRGTTEYFIKNHQGSLMMTVNENGNEPDKGRVVNDYLAFGDRRKLKDNGDAERITEVFTGKEYEDLYGLYYFGARFYDAELGVWISGDPAGQYLNPYSYVGGDVINCIDPFGLWSLHKLWRQTRNLTVQTGDFVVDNKEAFAMGAIVVGSIALGGTPALLAAGYGAAIGAGAGGGLELGRQLVEGKSLDQLRLSKIGSAALSGGLVGAATGGLAGAAGGSSFLGSATPYLHGVTNGAVLASGTGAGGLIGGGIGAANGNTSTGILSGGTSGFLAGTAVVGGAYGASSANQLIGLFGKATGFQLNIALQGLSNGLAGAAIGAAPGVAGAYYEGRGTGHEDEDIQAATSAGKPISKGLNCIPSPGKFNTDGPYYTTSPGHEDLQKNEFTTIIDGAVETYTDYTITGSPGSGRYIGHVTGGTTVNLNTCLDQ